MNGLVNRTVVWLTWRQLFAGRRIWLAAAFSLLPTLITIFYRLAMDDRPGSTLTFYRGFNSNIIIGTLVPLAAAVFGTTAFGGEVDDGTLVYLLVKPVARWRVALSKYLVAVMSTIAVMLPAMLLPWLILSGSEVTANALLGFLAGGALAAAVYCALFVLLGLASRRALVIALVYVIAFEAVLSRNLVGVKSLSVREFGIAASQAASRGAIVLEGYVVPMSTVWTVTAIALAASAVITLRRLSRYELAERV